MATDSWQVWTVRTSSCSATSSTCPLLLLLLLQLPIGRRLAARRTLRVEQLSHHRRRRLRALRRRPKQLRRLAYGRVDAIHPQRALCTSCDAHSHVSTCLVGSSSYSVRPCRRFGLLLAPIGEATSLRCSISIECLSR